MRAPVLAGAEGGVEEEAEWVNGLMDEWMVD